MDTNYKDFLDSLGGKESVYDAGDWDLIPGVGNDNPLQYSCLENSMGRGAWWTPVHGVTKSWTPLRGIKFKFHFQRNQIHKVEWRLVGMVEGEDGELLFSEYTVQAL